MNFLFEKLLAWQKVRLVIKRIYVAVNDFPEYEKYGLASQMRRSSISIASNLAEGSGRSSKKDQAHFYTIAYSSLLELVNQLILSYDMGYINHVELDQFRRDLHEVARMISGLRKVCKPT
jgi:four helix bundle protein